MELPLTTRKYIALLVGRTFKTVSFTPKNLAVENKINAIMIVSFKIYKYNVKNTKIEDVFGNMLTVSN